MIFEKENINTLTGDGKYILAVLSSFLMQAFNFIYENPEGEADYGMFFVEEYVIIKQHGMENIYNKYNNSIHLIYLKLINGIRREFW